MDRSPPASAVHGALQARILEWVAVPSSRASSQPRDRPRISYIHLHQQAGSVPLALPGKPHCWSVHRMCLLTQSCLTLCDPMNCNPPSSSVRGDSPDKTTGVGCHAPLQGIFPTQGLNPGLPHCRRILDQTTFLFLLDSGA